MARIPLNGKAYVERSVIASAQETINLYGELNTADSGAPVPITYYPTPGTTITSIPNTPAKTRCTYRTSLGTAFTVIGPNVYFVASNNALIYVGSIPDIQSQVYMADNGLVAVLVDGTSTGYAIELSTNNFAAITDPSFYGADFVVYLLTFFVFNRPKTNQFYISLSQVTFAMLTGIAIGTVFLNKPGSGGILGLYQSVALTGGSGTGATADIQVLNGVISDGNLADQGEDYVNGVYTGVALGGGAGTGIAADITVGGTGISNPTIEASGSGGTPGNYNNVALTGGSGTEATGNFVVSAGIIATGTLTAGGNGYVNGVYENVPLTGGAGVDATATITVAGNTVTNVVLTDFGTAYAGANVLSAAISNLGGTGGGFEWTVDTIVDGVSAFTINNPGINFVIGDVVSATSGNIGNTVGFQASVNAIGGIVTSVVFTGVNDLFGSGSLVGDVLTAPASSLGGTGSGFTWTVTQIVNGVSGVTIDTPGEGYLVDDILSATSADIGNVVGFECTVESVALAFDPLDIAAKSGSADPIVAILSIEEELWLVGNLTTEVWQGTGAADFFFQQVQGAYIEHGCTAQYSAANQDVLGFWLSEDRQGKNIVVEATPYSVREISTPYLVDQFDQYGTVSDAIGFCFQISGHPFYCLTFPTENITWLYELQTKQWNKWLWLDTTDGSLNRHRANCAMFFNDQVIIGDWENGNLYSLSSQVYTDFGGPIIRIKTFIHMLDNMDRTFYKNFDLDIQCGTQDPTLKTVPIVYLSWSDDRGVTYGYPVAQTMGEGGQFKTIVTWNRLGYARDRVFKAQWSEPLKTALNGGFCEVAKGRT